MRCQRYTENQVEGIFDEVRGKVRLAFCFPGNSWGIEFCNAWDAIQALCNKYRFPYRVVRYYEADIFRVRNGCLCGDWKGPKDQKIFQGDDVTHTLWLDNDTIMPPAAFLTMLTNHELDLVSGLVKTRENEGYAVYTMDQYDEQKQRFLPWQGEPDPENGYPFQIEHAGFACIMIKAEVFHKIGYPWFYPVPGMVKVGPMDDDWRVEYFTEDTGFCSLAKQAGFRVWADPRVHCGHIKSRMLT